MEVNYKKLGKLSLQIFQPKTTIPILAFYQTKNCISNYKPIKKDFSKRIPITIFNSMFGRRELFYYKNKSINDLKHYVSSILNIENNFILTINGLKADEELILSDIPNNNQNNLHFLMTQEDWL